MGNDSRTVPHTETRYVVRIIWWIIVWEVVDCQLI